MTPKPAPGDRRRKADGTLQIRVHRMLRDAQCLPIDRLTTNGRPRYEWLDLRAVEPWDEHLLTTDEIRALRYMRSREVSEEQGVWRRSVGNEA
jgi:hypothetical protein